MKGQGKWTNGAEWKYYEASFFYLKMKQNTHTLTDFLYYTSAFLSALRSCLEHKRLYSRDTRFKNWENDVVAECRKDPIVISLGKLRDTEVHRKDEGTFERLAFDLPPTLTANMVEVIKINNGPNGRTVRYRVKGTNLYCVTKVIESEWMWGIPGHPKILETCFKGLKAIEKVIDSRRKMKFL